jgi:hypothetical protein
MDGVRGDGVVPVRPRRIALAGLAGLPRQGRRHRGAYRHVRGAEREVETARPHLCGQWVVGAGLTGLISQRWWEFSGVGGPWLWIGGGQDEGGEASLSNEVNRRRAAEMFKLMAHAQLQVGH